MGFKLPSQQELKANGFKEEDFAHETTAHVWPEHWQTVNIFLMLTTQWRTGFSGPTGLDYNPLFSLLDKHYKEQKDWQQAFDDVRIIEQACLKEMNSND